MEGVKGSTEGYHLLYFINAKMMFTRSHDGAGVVNGMDLKSIGLWPRRFESCPSCNFFASKASTTSTSSPSNGKTHVAVSRVFFIFNFIADDNHFNEYSALPLMALAADFISVPSSLQQQEHHRR